MLQNGTGNQAIEGIEDMTRNQLTTHLQATALLEDVEIAQIVRTVGRYTIGNAIVACELLGIELTGNDIDMLIIN